MTAMRERPAVSLFMPAHAAGRETLQGPIRLGNLLREAERRLLADGCSSTEARELLSSAVDLIEDANFWRHQQGGLAIFLSPKVFRVYQFPLEVDESVSLSDRFTVKPLLPLLINDARFYILALSQKSVRLLEGSRDGAHEITVPGMPQGLQEGLPIGPAPEFQRYSLPPGGEGGETRVRIHGHGVGIDDADVTNLTRYFQRVEEALSAVLKDQKAPLVLACVEFLAPIFHRVTTYKHVTEDYVAGNPDRVKDEELHAKAWPIVEQRLKAAREKAVAEYAEGIAKGRGGRTLADVLPAAHQGRIATLLVPRGVHRWGRFFADSQAVEEHASEEAGDVDLVDLAAVQTLVPGPWRDRP
ncbi:MAG TPA: hypothetical protein VJR03_12040 [Nitrospira sp.]|nr:hypothetical protein [Nitrospira sp.]